MLGNPRYRRFANLYCFLELPAYPIGRRAQGHQGLKRCVHVSKIFATACKRGHAWRNPILAFAPTEPPLSFQDIQTNAALCTAQLVEPLESAWAAGQHREGAPAGHAERKQSMYSRLLQRLLGSNRRGLVLLALLHLGLKAASLAGPIFLRLIITGLACRAKAEAEESRGTASRSKLEHCDSQSNLYL